MPERIAKRLAHAGVASRREAERLIEQGRVAVNGTALESPAFTVEPDDVVTVDGERIGAQPGLRMWRLYKTEGTVVTRSDERDRPTVFDLLPENRGHIVAVGRLDMNTEGLLLLTNDGELARWLELPETGWARRYRVRVYGRPDDTMLKKLRAGMTVDGIRYGPIDTTIDSQSGANAWLTMTLREGKNREIRKVLGALDLNVNRLLRTAYGPFQLGALKRGKHEEVNGKILKEQLGQRWADRIDAHRRRPA
ncbi:MAG: rRNA pseudouridine synthase [Rhodospirillales bacterium]|nr:rRNA pseudouridine synthase [Rhodospirillales bacterium]